MTTTQTVTNTHLAVATLAMAGATAIALVAAPTGNDQNMVVAQLNDEQNCSAVRTEFQVSSPSANPGKFKRIIFRCPATPEKRVNLSTARFETREALLERAARWCRARRRCVAPTPSVQNTGSLTVSIDNDTPLATNLMMGEFARPVAKFRLTAGEAEDLNVNELTVSFNMNREVTSTLRNVVLYDGEAVLATASMPLSSFNNASVRQAVFRGFNLVIPRNDSKVITVKVDVSPYEDSLRSGYSFQPFMMNGDTDIINAGVQLSVLARGAQSGELLGADRVGFIANGLGTFAWSHVRQMRADGTPVTQLLPVFGHVNANEFVVYRTKLTVAWASDTPSGSAAASMAQTVGKFIVSNQANLGNYSATVKAVNFDISTTISNSRENQATRAMNVYKDSMATTPLATTQWYWFFANPNFGSTAFRDSSFTDVEIASGESKTFFVTLDTVDASTNNYLNLNIRDSHSVDGYKYYGILWSDGETEGEYGIVAHDNLLPLASKTFTY